MMIQRNSADIKKLYSAQDQIIARLQPYLDANPAIWLSGGTVLAREWLNHRVSFDLDFFVPHEFDLASWQKQIRRTGFETVRAAFGEDIYQQLFGGYKIDGMFVEVSFIQDRLHHKIKPMKGSRFLNAPLESVEDVYMRKASIIIGLSEHYSFGRSKARDMLDLFALSQTIEPVTEFVRRKWGEAMLENFFEGLANVDVMALLKDDRYFVYPEWEQAIDGEAAYNLLLQECGMEMQDIDDAWREYDEKGNLRP